MSSYTVSGYLSALVLRDKKTVLLEGRNDRKVVARVAAEIAETRKGVLTNVVLDSADLVRGDDGPMGNRALVELIHQSVRATGTKFAAVVDREFRGFELASVVRDEIGEHRTENGSLFWTRGHSMENYFFDARFFTSFIKSAFAEAIEAECVMACRSSFDEILIWASAVGITLKENGLIEKGHDLGRVSHWTRASDGRWRFDATAFSRALAERAIVPGGEERIVGSVEAWRSRLDEAGAKEVVRWVSHGHIGWQLVWSGLGAVAKHIGAPPAVVQGISHGYADMKWRKAADMLAEDVSSNAQVALPQLWAWMEEASLAA